MKRGPFVKSPFPVINVSKISAEWSYCCRNAESPLQNRKCFNRQKQCQPPTRYVPGIGDIFPEPRPQLRKAEEDERRGEEERVADGEPREEGREGISARE